MSDSTRSPGPGHSSPDSNASGASLLRTPACQLTKEGFSSLFDHHKIDDQKQFERVALDKKEMPSRVYPAVDIKERLAESQETMQQYLANWLEQLDDNVSTTELMNQEQNRQKKRKASGGNGSIVDEVSIECANQPIEKAHSQLALKNLFTNYKSFLVNNGNNGKEWHNYPEDPRGCLVTKTSRQDIACLNKETSILFQGECKNGDYVHMDGVRQCAGYLYHQLWWFRTIQGVDVRRVYGFAVSGPKCQYVGQHQAVVSLLVLSAPDAGIGSPLKLYDYKQVLNIDEDLFSVLGNFVRSDLFRELNDLGVIPAGGRWPGCMMIPPDILLHRMSVEEDPCWDIVPNGTAALVIRLRARNDNLEKVKAFMENVCCQSDIFEAPLRKFPGKACRAEESVFYLKMRTYASGPNWSDILPLTSALYALDFDEDQDPKLKTWRKTYARNLLPFIQGKSYTLLVMIDMGHRFIEESAQKPKYAEFCKEFDRMMDEALHVQEESGLVHGDIHPGNLLYKSDAPDDECKLRLIDWDEAHTQLRVRITLTDEQKERYPTGLGGNDEEAYTMAQLLILFRDVSKLSYQRYVCTGSDGSIEVQEQKGLELELGATPAEVKQQYEELKTFLLRQGSSS